MVCVGKRYRLSCKEYILLLRFLVSNVCIFYTVRPGVPFKRRFSPMLLLLAHVGLLVQAFADLFVFAATYIACSNNIVLCKRFIVATTFQVRVKNKNATLGKIFNYYLHIKSLC
jgi:hypothetical protein